MSNVHSAANTDTFKIGNYVAYKERIGKGGSGTIYKGYHKITKKEVAIKQIPVSDVTKIKKNIRNEIEVMSQLKHPNIVEYYDHILDTKYNYIYVIMEYCHQGDFYKFQKKRSIQEVHVQKFMKQLAAGLKYLKCNNGREIMHRDLKPQNILVAKDGSLKLTDFGFAKILNQDAMIKTFCGSPLYMAPEIIKCKGQDEYTNVSDLWSVGCIFYEMLVGIPPYPAKSINELVKKIEDNSEIYYPKHLTISDECKSLVNQLLERDPIKRIPWNDFFKHSWFNKDLLSDEENRLLAFDINDSKFTTNLPSVSLYRRNTRIFASTHLTDSERIRFKLKNKEFIDQNSLMSIPNKSSQEYIIVGTPPDRAQEKERLRQLTKIIEEKVESNVIEDRKLNDIYQEYQQYNKQTDENMVDEMFFSCESLGSETNNVIETDNVIELEKQLKQELKEKHNNKVKKELNIIINELIDSKESEHDLSFDFNDMFDLDNNDMLTASVNHNYHKDYFQKSVTNTYDFSTSLISTENSFITENTEPYVIIKPSLNSITKSDQHEYKKSKLKNIVTSSFGLLKGSLDYFNYNHSL
jgi:serine/threonine protein kinase